MSGWFWATPDSAGRLRSTATCHACIRKLSSSLLDLVPPEHGRQPRLVAEAFTVRRVEQLRARAEDVAESLVDAAVAKGSSIDLVESFAEPLPGIMICELLGVPYVDRDDFREWANTFVSVTTLTAKQRQTYRRPLRAYVAGLVGAAGGHAGRRSHQRARDRQ